MNSITIRLSIMMFLQFFVWGAWYVTAPNYLGTIGFGARDFGWTYSVGPIAGMITPFFVGMVADRFFPAERVLGLLHLLGAGLMVVASQLMRVETPSPGMINVVFFGYMLTYFPTLALANTLAMRNLTDSTKQFPLIRVFGTIGWIVAGFTLTWSAMDTTIGMFYLTASAALLLGIVSFFLPHTPPEAKGKTSIREVLGIDALVLLKDRSYLVFILASMLICIPLAFYYQITSRVVEMVRLPIAQTMTYGQISEIFFMLVMPFFFARLGVKWMLAVGMLAWVVRYLLFAFGAPDEVAWMILIGIILHGICYDFFFVTGQIYTDNKSPLHLRAQAQGLLVFFTLGMGMLIGAQVAGRVEERFTTDESQARSAEVVEVGSAIEALKAQIPRGEQADAALSAEIDALEEQKEELRHAELAAIDWKPLWLMPASFAAGVLVLFLLLFREKNGRSRAGDPVAEGVEGSPVSGPPAP
ncbi:MFS transporter [soil metagenome]